MLTFQEFMLLEKQNNYNYNHRELSNHLKDHGWSLERQQGSHDVWSHPKSTQKIAVPRHKGDLAYGTVKQIIKSSTTFDK